MIFFIEIVVLFIYTSNELTAEEILKQISHIILIMTLTGLSYAIDLVEDIRNISFKDAVWDRFDNLLLSSKRLGDISSSRNAVVLYFFTAQFC